MKVRFQRAELHNHTTESDGKLTVSELMNYAAEEDFGVIALTDHNTVSGHEKAEETIRREKLPLSLICGVEATTFYGHILALGTS
ncbi:MAG: PHP domain-containing protein, partial [Fusicatenibacter sp.]|nr:PHP domain-containing protein [Fusicatenibacter sp.]